MYKLYKKNIFEISQKIAGPEAEKIVQFLKEKDDYISEIKIAKKLKLDINLVRSIIYKLQNENVLWSIKLKEKDKNWYIYHWKLNTEQLRKIIKEDAQRILDEKIKKYEKEKNKEYFVCPNKCAKLTFEESMNNKFKCTECGEILAKYDNKPQLRGLKKEIIELKRKIKERTLKHPTKARKTIKRPTKKKIVKTKKTKAKKKQAAKATIKKKAKKKTLKKIKTRKTKK